MTSGIVCVTKPDKSIRLCCDYRYLNKYTIPDSTPMKLICVHKVAPARFISIWDAKSGFWQLMVRPEDRWKCAFVIHHGVWSWKRMPFGLRNAPATFVKAIRKVLYPIREHSDAYVDDMYTISHSFVDHLKHLRAFLLYTDASLYAVGCCLAQKDESGDKHPIAYGSHKLTPNSM